MNRRTAAGIDRASGINIAGSRPASRASAPRNCIFWHLRAARFTVPRALRRGDHYPQRPEIPECRQICATANSTDGCGRAYEGGFLNIIGISAGYHDSACCLMQRGGIVAAAQEERFSRIKNDKAFPAAALYYLDQAGLTIADIECVALYEHRTGVIHKWTWRNARRARPYKSTRRSDGA